MTALSVADVLATPALRAAGPTVLAGADALDKRVRWVHSAELADIAPLLREGDLLLSTGIAMPDTSDELHQFATSLSEGDAAGLVIELGRRWQHLPRSLIQACEQLGLPLVALTSEVRFAAVIQAVGERLIASQLTELREAQRVHDTFTELSIDEAGPEEILAAVQRLSGATVVLESEQHQVLDYRSGPDDVADFLANWTTRSRHVRVEGRTTWDSDLGWLVTQIGKRERRWGRLVVQTPSPPPERMVALVERAAAALALHRLHDRQRDSVVRRAHHELLVGLLADPTVPDLLRRCEVAGLPTERRHFVGITLRPRIDRAVEGGGALLIDEAIAATVHSAHEMQLPALVSELDHNVRALVSLPRSVDADRVVDDLAARVARRVAVLIGAGRPAPRPAEIDRTLRESHQVVQSIRDTKADERVHRLDDVHLRGLLAMLAEDDRVATFVDRELAALREYDEHYGSHLTDTVRALVTHPTSKAEAATSLRVSRPVFYDRLAKASRVIGADLDDPDIRASLHVALLADEITGGSAT
ncbi:PucR family transcriptional regulator [Haloechinothrix salitolerans]|uniref:PucR family transcriptional regulator n=1 Tax=Haloechinothrix salitolerans TaxID=926830 RepID=A0ABW2C6S6_9PSEU